MVNLEKTMRCCLTRSVRTLLSASLAAGCHARQPATPPPRPPIDRTASTREHPPTAVAPAPVPAAVPAPAREPAGTPVTLPVLDAMFSDPGFAAALSAALELTADQVERLRASARSMTAGLMERVDGSTRAAARHADETILGVVGAEKAERLARFVRDYWTRDDDGNPIPPPPVASQPGNIPSDTRIVVNVPAYRMDVFRDGALAGTYKIGIGFPEFPLPTGIRIARSIIFNPTWTPPDEPWVTGDMVVGKRVAAGSKKNPLGAIKIPIGMPSLIHGGKQAAMLGGFASHGCVGLTNVQVKRFARALAEISNTTIAPADLLAYERDTKRTRQVRLAAAVPIELRYETIVVEAGKLRIYRDVYEHGTNTEENLQRVLLANGVAPPLLSDSERARITTALQQMARAPDGAVAEVLPGADRSSTSPDVTRRIKGAKVVEIELTALAGKGYPAPHVRTGAGKPTWW